MTLRMIIILLSHIIKKSIILAYFPWSNTWFITGSWFVQLALSPHPWLLDFSEEADLGSCWQKLIKNCSVSHYQKARDIIILWIECHWQPQQCSRNAARLPAHLYPLLHNLAALMFTKHKYLSLDNHLHNKNNKLSWQSCKKSFQAKSEIQLEDQVSVYQIDSI